MRRLVVCLLVLAFSAVVNAGFSDDFTDGNRDGWWKTNDSANYSLTVEDDSSGIGSGNALFLTTDSNTRRVLSGFSPTILLNVDDFITLSFDIRLNGVTDTSNALRFGLNSDMGTPMDTDYTDVTASPAADDQGYYIRMGTGTGTTVQIYKDTDQYILGGSDASSSYQQYSGSYAGINDTEKHHVDFTIMRTSDGMAFRLNIDGATVVDASKVTAYPLTEYNQIGFASYSGGLDFVLDNVTVVPEPTTLLLLGTGGLLWTRQRRNR